MHANKVRSTFSLSPFAKHFLKVSPQALVVGPGVYALLLIHLNGGAVGGQHVGVHHQEASKAHRKRTVDDDADERNCGPAQTATHQYKTAG